MTIKSSTVYIKFDDPSAEGDKYQQAGKVLREGGLVAFPTETVYGLGANALDPAAVNRIFAAKGRPSDNPLIVHISDTEQVYDIARDITVPAQRVMEVFWPGPLTVVLPKKAVVPAEVTGGLDTVAIRVPDNEIARKLIRAAGVPVAAPSANTSGKPSPTTAQHVLADLEGKIDVLVDGGGCRVGLESTVLDLTTEPPVILRPGGITREDLEGVLGHVEAGPPATDQGEDDPGLERVPKSPGMKYTHYAPEAEVIVVVGEQSLIPDKVAELVSEFRRRGRRTGVLASAENAGKYRADEIFTVGSRGNLEEVARNLFNGLRILDNRSVDIIIAEGYPDIGMGAAIMNRLIKSAGYNLIQV